MKNKYLTELSRRLSEGGIQSTIREDRRLDIFLHDRPVLYVSPSNDVFLLPAGSQNEEASELYHQVAVTADEVYEYVEAMENAPPLRVSGLHEDFRLLADFGGTVLAGLERENGQGYQFVNWVWAYERQGLCHGHYFEDDFQSAKQEFTDAGQYLQTIREELPYRDTTGFRYETLTNDPQVRKAVDDVLLDFAGEENPRRACNYGLTEAGKQALRDAADPNKPHTYAWFVLTDCGAPEEQIHRDLTMEEAIQLYRDSDRLEKRLGVSKDGIATVDLVRSLDGEQQFFDDCRRLESFRDDPVVAGAVETLHQELEQTASQEDITMGGM